MPKMITEKREKLILDKPRELNGSEQWPKRPRCPRSGSCTRFASNAVKKYNVRENDMESRIWRPGKH
jgi:hypothetical protein